MVATAETTANPAKTRTSAAQVRQNQLGVLRRPNVRSAAIFIALSYATALASYAISFFLARRLGDEFFGQLSFGLVTSSILSTLILFGFDRTLVRDLIQRPHPEDTFTGSLRIRAILTAIVVPGAIAAMILGGVRADLLITASICCFHGACMALSPRGWFDYRRRMSRHAALLLLERVIYGCLVVVVIFAVPGGARSWPVALALLAATLASTIWQYRWSVRKLGLRLMNTPSNTHGLAAANIPIIAAALGNLGMTHVNQLILHGQRGNAALAHYAIAFQLIQASQLFAGQLNRFLALHIANVTALPRAEIRKSLRKTVLRSLALSGITSLAVVLVGSIAIIMLLPPSFRPSTRILWVLGIWSTLYGVALTVNSFLLGLGRNNSFFLIATCCGLMAVIASALLIPAYGGMGAALALLIGHATSIGLQMFVVYRAIR